jgi:branched-chain amino acid aminotransferase
MTRMSADASTVTSATPLVLPLAQPRPLVTEDGRAGFGEAFTSTMAFATWGDDEGWSDLSFTARRPLLIDPAMVGVHYGQIVFEGLKAHRLPEGHLAVFRPDAYALRMQQSARRFAMPEPPADLFVSATTGLAALDREWLPEETEAALYLRPVLMATQPSLGLRPSTSYLFMVIAFVTGGFFHDDPEPITVKVERTFVRAVRGGTGDAKCPGNYAPTYLAQIAAERDGCHQVVWLDAIEQRQVEELGGMNLFFVHATDGPVTISTPPLSGTILPGITRDTLIELARNLGYRVLEQAMDVRRWQEDCVSGSITETFACGTAATVTPVGTVIGDRGTWSIGGCPGPVTLVLREELRKAWQGLAGDRDRWIQVVGQLSIQVAGSLGRTDRHDRAARGPITGLADKNVAQYTKCAK